VWSAAVWVASEALRARCRGAGCRGDASGFGQPDGPLLPLAAIGGEPLLSFVTVLVGLALGEAVRRAVVWWRAGRSASGTATQPVAGRRAEAGDGAAAAAPSRPRFAHRRR
jgi:apolipoprotein N-acyltransferase